MRGIGTDRKGNRSTASEGRDQVVLVARLFNILRSCDRVMGPPARGRQGGTAILRLCRKLVFVACARKDGALCKASAVVSTNVNWIWAGYEVAQSWEGESEKVRDGQL